MPATDSASDHPRRLRWRERALRDTRQRLHQLQIEMHRVKADLARLEAENETELADELANEGGGDFSVAVEERPPRSSVPRPRASAVRVDLSPDRKSSAQLRNGSSPTLCRGFNSHTRGSVARPPAKRRKKSSPAWVLSMGAHGLIFLLLAPLSYVILNNERTPLMATMFGPETIEVEDPGTAPIELVSFEDFEAPVDVVEAIADLPQSELSNFGPLESELVGESASEVGQLNALPTDVGMLLAGGGVGDDRGAKGGGGRGAAGDQARLGTTNFFGTPARANRVVFLVDNSGSMKQGRMETTLLELARSIESLGEKQEFYVVFYSDQAYPMFYPHSEMKAVAATRENKERLYRWLQTIELCTGGALLKAVEIAESLEPQVVYILSDGNITSRRTLEQLTQAHARKFAVHTLGMGVAKPQDAQNLAAIATAHRGTFQMVRPLPAAIQMAKNQPIRSNSFGVSWGQGAFQP